VNEETKKDDLTQPTQPADIELVESDLEPVSGGATVPYEFECDKS
jgi:hypothetical protein